jgi:hypothetical protein
VTADDGLIGDDVFEQPKTTTLPTTTARATNDQRADIESSFSIVRVAESLASGGQRLWLYHRAIGRTSYVTT